MELGALAGYVRRERRLAAARQEVVRVREALAPVAAVPDPRPEELDAVAFRRPGEGRDRAGLPLDVQPPGFLARAGEVAGPEQGLILRVDIDVRVEVVPVVALRQVGSGGVGGARRSLDHLRARVLEDEDPLG